jgi:hypothetical protein
LTAVVRIVDGGKQEQQHERASATLAKQRVEL